MVTQSPPAAPVFPAGRYGRRRTPRRHAKLVSGLAAVVVLGVTSWIGVRLYAAYGEGDYSSAVTRFVTGEREVSVEFIVRIPGGGTASCVVRARNADGAEVGRETVRVAAGTDPAHTRTTYRLVTSDRPVTGEVRGCVAAETTATLR